MSRNGRREEIGFGSDSFLDIVANIVGILIILIVIAGVRVGRQPVSPEIAKAGPTGASDDTSGSARGDPQSVAVSTASERAGEAAKGAPQPPRALPTGEPPAQDASDSAASVAAARDGQAEKAEGREALETARRSAEPHDRQQHERDRELREALEERERQWQDYRAAMSRLAWQDGVLRRLRDERQRLEGELARLTEQAEKQRRRVAELEGELQAKTAATGPLQDRLIAARQRLQAVREERARVQDRLQRVRLALQRSRQVQKTLAAELAATEKAEAPVKELKHRINPVGRQVSGPELHVRLLREKVAVVPLEALAERLKDDLRRRRNWLLEYGTYEGAVGPLEGFSMRYLVERQTPSVLDEIRYGRGYVQFGVTYWELVPQPDLPEEDVEQALGLHGRLRQRLATAATGTTVTVWVYPDSFGAFQVLDAALHRMGFEVAARPLPFGIPIAGSPHGTRSIGQ